MLLYIIKQAYDEFEQRAGDVAAPKGEQTALMNAAINEFSDDFSVADIQHACPGVSVDLIRRTLKKLRAADQVECLGLRLRRHQRPAP